MKRRNWLAWLYESEPELLLHIWRLAVEPLLPRTGPILWGHMRPPRYVARCLPALTRLLQHGHGAPPARPPRKAAGAAGGCSGGGTTCDGGGSGTKEERASQGAAAAAGAGGGWVDKRATPP